MKVRSPPPKGGSGAALGPALGDAFFSAFGPTPPEAVSVYGQGKGCFGAGTSVFHWTYSDFFYRPRTLNYFRGQGVPRGRLILIGRLIIFGVRGYLADA